MTDAAANMGPLQGLKVVEMGTLIAGPFCGQILGDFGADVVKIEDPKTGDPMRQWGRSLPKGLSPWWPVIGRNKRSVGAFASGSSWASTSVATRTKSRKEPVHCR